MVFHSPNYLSPAALVCGAHMAAFIVEMQTPRTHLTGGLQAARPIDSETCAY